MKSPVADSFCAWLYYVTARKFPRCSKETETVGAVFYAAFVGDGGGEVGFGDISAERFDFSDCLYCCNCWLFWFGEREEAEGGLREVFLRPCQQEHRQQRGKVCVRQQRLHCRKDCAIAWVAVVSGGEQQTVCRAVFLAQCRVKRHGLQRQRDARKREVVYSLVKVFDCPQWVAEVFRPDCRRLLSFHRGDEHAVVVYQCQCAVLANHHVVRLDVAVRKRLRTKPRRHAAEAVAQHRHGAGVAPVRGDVRLHGLTLYPVHQQYREAVVVAGAVHEQLPLVVLHRGDVARIDSLQLVGDAAVCLGSPLLLLREAFQRVATPSFRVTHLEDDSKRAAAAVRLAVLVCHRLEVRQFVEVARRVLYGADVFRNKRVLHLSWLLVSLAKLAISPRLHNRGGGDLW